MRYLYPQRVDCLICGKDFGTARSDVELSTLGRAVRAHWKADHPAEEAAHRQRVLDDDGRPS